MRKCLLALAITLLCLNLFAQSVLKEAAPASAGFSAERLQRIDKLMQEYVDKKWMPGASILIAREGKIVYHKAFGYSNLDTKKPLQKDDIFRIASQTKAVTAVGVLMLYEEGKFGLDDPIGNYIPAFKKMEVLDKFNAADTTYTTVPAKSAITIRQLLTHTSGIGYAQIGSNESNAIYYKNGIMGGLGVGNLLLADQMKTLGKLPLMHQPGEKWTYGLNIDLLGYLIEVVSGQSLDEFLRTRIFEPLGMKDTYFFLPKSKYNRLVKVASENEEKESVFMKDRYFTMNGTVDVEYPATEGTFFSGGGGLNCTALDYGIFMQMLLNNGEYNGKRILSPTTVTMMRSPQFHPAYWDDKFMGLGVGIYTEKSVPKTPPSPGSFEWGGFFSSSFWVDPEKKIIAQLFINQFPHSHGEIHNKFKVLVYAALEAMQ
ncbi:MAG: beta-lactamase family protein [Chitinophagaceae bacterium]|nr:beta-lactamase family protein [Chitinophagaceae bacterium]